MKRRSRFRRAAIRASGADANTGPVAEAFTKAGASVQVVTNVGDGFPDLVVGYRGVTHLVEVKRKAERGKVMPSEVKLRPAQEKFRRTWRGEVPLVVRTPEEALGWVRAWSKMPGLPKSTPAPVRPIVSEMALPGFAEIAADAVAAWEADRARRNGGGA